MVTILKPLGEFILSKVADKLWNTLTEKDMTSILNKVFDDMTKKK